jgi:hypothetical protein
MTSNNVLETRPMLPHSFPMQPKTKSQWDFNPNALTLPYVLIIVGAAVSLFVFRFFVSHEAFIK